MEKSGPIERPYINRFYCSMYGKKLKFASNMPIFIGMLAPYDSQYGFMKMLLVNPPPLPAMNLASLSLQLQTCIEFSLRDDKAVWNIE